MSLPKPLSPVSRNLATRTTLLGLCLLLFALSVSAQERYQVGQKVEFYCACYGPTAWTPGTIEEDQGNGTYRVRFDTGRYDYKNAVSAQYIRAPGSGEREERQAERRRLFMAEAEQYKQAVGSVAGLFDSTLSNTNIYTRPNTASEWATVMKDLAALDTLCTTKYPLMKNPEDSARFKNIFQMPATWCEIAAARAGYQTNANNQNFQNTLDINLNSARLQIQRAIDDPRNHTGDGVQELLFETEKAKANLMTSLKAPGKPFPAASFAPLQEKLDELKALIESGAPNRHWEQPPFNRPVEQGLARPKFLAYYPGVTILKIGSSFTDWKMYKNSLGIPTNRFIRGWILLKRPNRPFCQAQEWIIKQEYAGGGRWSASKVDSFGGGGTFMSCN
jgi:hypothetical protein